MFFQSEALLFSRDDCDSYNPFLNDEVGTFCEHIRLANKVALIIRDLQRGQKEESAVDVKDRLFHSINRGSISSGFNKAKNIWDDKHTILLDPSFDFIISETGGERKCANSVLNDSK